MDHRVLHVNAYLQNYPQNRQRPAWAACIALQRSAAAFIIRSMANVSPVKYRIPVTIRVDEEFVEAVKELRRESDDPPTKSEVIRKAVIEARDRERRRQTERKRANGR